MPKPPEHDSFCLLVYKDPETGNWQVVGEGDAALHNGIREASLAGITSLQQLPKSMRPTDGLYIVGTAAHISSEGI